MDNPQADLHTSENEEKIVLAKPPIPTRFGTIKEKVTSLSKNRSLQLGLGLLLVATVPFTILQSFKQQDIQQHAAATTGYDMATWKLPEFTTLEQLETELSKSVDGGQYPIGLDDYLKCPVAAPYHDTSNPGRTSDCDQKGVIWGNPAIPPGTLNQEEAHCKANQYAGGPNGGGACENDTTPNDPWYFFGTVGDSTSTNDIFYTVGQANYEARLAGSCIFRSAHCRDRGCMYYAVDGPDDTWAGGWHYQRSKDSACWGISTWSCARSGWSRAMGWAQTRWRQYAEKKTPGWSSGKPFTVFPDRRCILSLAVMEVRSECKRAENGECGEGSDKNVANVGFFLDPTTPRSAGGSSKAVALVMQTAASDKSSCEKTDTHFTDLTPGDSCLEKAVTALSTSTGTSPACTARGYGGGIFAPANPVTREEFLAFITRYHVYVAKDWKYIDVSSTTDLPDSKLYSDVPRNHPQALNIYTAALKGFTDTDVGKEYKPADPWNWKWSASSGIDKVDKAAQASITRGEVVVGLYNYGIGKQQLTGVACNAVAATAEKPPAPFTEGVDQEDEAKAAARRAVCGKNDSNPTTESSLLNGFIVSAPTVTAFNDRILLFAKGKENKLYMRTFGVSKGRITDLASSPWIDLGKTVNNTPITAYTNTSKTLFVIVTGADGKLYSRSTKTGTTLSDWSDWTNSIPEGYIPGKADTDGIAVLDQFTYSFTKGIGDSVPNNVCLSFIAAPGFVSGGSGAVPGGGGSQPATPAPKVPTITPANPSTTYVIGGAYYEVPPFPDDLTFYAKPIPPTTFTPDPVKAKGQVFQFLKVPAGTYRIYAETVPNFLQTLPPTTNDVNTNYSYVVTAGPGCTISPKREKNGDKTECVSSENPSGLVFEFDPANTDPASAFNSCVNTCQNDGDGVKTRDYCETVICKDKLPQSSLAQRTAENQPNLLQQMGSGVVGLVTTVVTAAGDVFHAVNPFD